MTKRSIEDVLGAIKVPVRSVSVCLNGDLRAEHDELSQKLERLRRENAGKGAEALEVAEQIRAVEAEMSESEVTFKFRGLTKAGLNKLYERFPKPDPNPDNLRWNIEDGAYALLSASAVEPVMSEGQAQQLVETVDQGTLNELVGAAWMASTGSTQIPFSVRASALTSGTGSN